MKIGYARVSTSNQSLDRQLDNLREQGCERIFQEKITGTKAHRPELDRMMDTLHEGDTLIVESFSRLSRSTKDLLDMVDKLTQMGVNLVSLTEHIDITTPSGRMTLGIIGALSQAEHDLASTRTKDGLKAANLRGKHGGRPKIGDPVKKAKAIAMYNENIKTNNVIAMEIGISTATLSRWISEYKISQINNNIAI